MPSLNDPYSPPSRLDDHHQTADEAPIPTSGRGRMKAMGVIQIILGGLCLLFFLVGLLSLAFQANISTPSAPQTQGAAYIGIGSYILFGVAFIWLGVGSLRLRRWVRPVVLSLMWPALVIGVIAAAASFFVVPNMMRAAPVPGGASNEAYAAIMSVIIGITLGVLVLIYIVIPGVHVLMYQPARIRTLCEAADPKARWTDKTPIPVLGVSIWLGISAISMLLLVGIPFINLFGLVLSGIPAQITAVVLSATAAGLAYLVYKRSMLGWWGATSLYSLLFLGTGVGYLFVDLMELYRHTGMYTEQQLETMSPMIEPMNALVAPFAFVTAAAAIIYMVVTRHYYGTRSA